jgi:hypothetical protein
MFRGLQPTTRRELATHSRPLIIRDVASRKEITRVDTGSGGPSILISPDASRAHIAIAGGDEVAAVDAGKREVVSEIKTGDGPDGKAWAGKRSAALAEPTPDAIARTPRHNDQEQESVG